MRADDGSDCVLRIAGADGSYLQLRALPGELRHTLHHHGAVVLAVTAAAGGQPSFGVLSQRKRRRDGRKTNCGEQDEAEKTAQEH